jgi:hypothetical protein
MLIYSRPSGGDVCGATESAQDLPLVAGTIANVKASVSTPPANGFGTQSWTITVRITGAGSSQACTISGSSTTCTTGGASASVGAADTVVVRAVGSNDPAATQLAFAAEFTPS